VGLAAPVYLGDEMSLCGQFTVTLDAGNPGATYLWSTGATSQTIDVALAGEYWVQVNNNNCIQNDTISITGAPGEGIIFVPNTFTPNGNATNPTFMAYGDGIVKFQMRIFDRWGNLLYETTDINAGWDGRYKGKVVQVDSYVYVIEYQTTCAGGKTIKKIGHVNVLR
jgi:gliding motility-associated-like protein